jgi:hypothetical protein
MTHKATARRGVLLGLSALPLTPVLARAANWSPGGRLVMFIVPFAAGGW